MAPAASGHMLMAVIAVTGRFAGRVIFSKSGFADRSQCPISMQRISHRRHAKGKAHKRHYQQFQHRLGGSEHHAGLFANPTENTEITG
jgi:hypothetical protein